jgi:hypothetical protein
MADANTAAPPNISVKTGFSLSTIRAQTRDRGRITRGFKRNEPAKTSDSTNLKIYGNIDSN